MHSRGLNIGNQSHSVHVSISSQVALHVTTAHSRTIMWTPGYKTFQPPYFTLSLTRWYTPNCPRPDECKRLRWQKWEKTEMCRSYKSEYDCRQRILAHLLRSGCHDQEMHTKLTMEQWAANAEVRQTPDECVCFPEDLQSPKDDDINIYFADRSTDHLDQTEVKPTIAAKEDGGDDADGRNTTRPAEDDRSAPDRHNKKRQSPGRGPEQGEPKSNLRRTASVDQAICAGRSACYSKTMAGDVAAVRIKRTGDTIPLAVYRKQ